VKYASASDGVSIAFVDAGGDGIPVLYMRGFLFSARGERALRGFADPVAVYAVSWREEPPAVAPEMAGLIARSAGD